MNFRIARLVDYPEVIPTLAEAFGREWPNWYPVHGDAVADLLERARIDGLPLGLIALENGQAVGTLAISRNAPQSYSRFQPWIAGFWVAPVWRHMGVGTMLITAACEEARGQGFARMYASTAKAAGLFTRSGWSHIGSGASEGGEAVEIFALTLV